MDINQLTFFQQLVQQQSNLKDQYNQLEATNINTSIPTLTPHIFETITETISTCEKANEVISVFEDGNSTEYDRLKCFKESQKLNVERLKNDFTNTNLNSDSACEWLKTNFEDVLIEYMDILSGVDKENCAQKEKMRLKQMKVDVESAKWDETTVEKEHSNSEILKTYEDDPHTLKQLSSNEKLLPLIYSKSAYLEIYLPLAEAVYFLKFRNNLTFDLILRYVVLYGELSTNPQLTIADEVSVNTERNIQIIFKTYRKSTLHELSMFFIRVYLEDSKRFELKLLSNYLFIDEVLVAKFRFDDQYLTIKHDLFKLKEISQKENPEINISIRQLLQLRTDAFLMMKQLKISLIESFHIALKVFMQNMPIKDKYSVDKLCDEIESSVKI